MSRLRVSSPAWGAGSVGHFPRQGGHTEPPLRRKPHLRIDKANLRAPVGPNATDLGARTGLNADRGVGDPASGDLDGLLLAELADGLAVEGELLGVLFHDQAPFELRLPQ